MKGTVFILEDDTSICGLIKVALEMNGLEFKAFSTLKSFLDALNKEQPDVALLDVLDVADFAAFHPGDQIFLFPHPHSIVPPRCIFS